MDDKFLTAAEVAALFRVDPKTVSRWALNGGLPSIKTPGGHRRYRESVIMAIINGPGRPPLRAVDAA